ncbi:MAG: hypothetical protein ACRDBM_03510 [Sporomusa sp.]
MKNNNTHRKPPKNRRSVKRDNVLTQFHGIVAQDHESKFYNFGDKHATCGAHLSRELTGLAELNLLEWAAEFRVFFRGNEHSQKQGLSQGISACDPVLLA